MTTTDEVVTPEVMPSPGGGLVHAPGTEVAEPTVSAIDRAAEAALAMPGVPGRDEFLSLAAQAKMLSLSGAAPKAVRENPHIAFHVAMVGRDLGISPTAAINLIDVLNTQGGYQLSLSPQLLNAQIRRLGLGAVRPVVQERDRAVAVAIGPNGEELGRTEFTWEDARDAGLVGPNCQPGEHVETTRQRSQDRGGGSYKTCGCNQGYRTYPRRMMWWRAAGFCAADWFPDASVGLYSPEELGAVVDEQGRPIDPAQVALPPGYSDPVAEKAERQAVADRPASPDKLWELQELVYALPAELLAEFRAAWKANDRLSPFPLRHLPQRLLGTARAMVNAQWAAATKAGFDKATEEDRLRHRLAEGVAYLFRAGAPAQDPAAVAAPAPQDGPGEPSGSAGSGETATGHTAPLPAEPEFDVDGDGQGASEPERDWTPVLRQLADEVRAQLAKIPTDVGERIMRAVAAMHHTAVNRVIADAGEAEAYPPELHIDGRRMAATIVAAAAFEVSGEIHPEVVAVEEKAQG